MSSEWRDDIQRALDREKLIREAISNDANSKGSVNIDGITVQGCPLKRVVRNVRTVKRMESELEDQRTAEARITQSAQERVENNMILLQRFAQERRIALNLLRAQLREHDILECACEACKFLREVDS